ncbi:unnamed protein product, partial [Prorocentrum cordatum]
RLSSHFGSSHVGSSRLQSMCCCSIALQKHMVCQAHCLRYVSRVVATRACTTVELRGVSQFRGVSYDRRDNTWQVRVMHDRQLHRLGKFDCPRHAASVYDDFLRSCDLRKHSAIRRLNFPTVEEEKVLLDFSDETRRFANLVRYSDNHAKEARAMQIIEMSISSSLECEWLREGTLADGIFRPSMCLDDAWIGIQVKSTARKVHGAYRFNRVNRYAGLVVLCIGLDRDLLWLIPGVDLKVASLGIYSGGKWSGYHCPWHDLSSTLRSVWGNTAKFKKLPAEHWKTPISLSQQKEYLAHKLGAEWLRTAGLTITAPSVAHGPVDMIIDGRIRVQTKSRSIEKSGIASYQVTLWRKAGPGRHRPYSAHEFDVLVIYLVRSANLVGMFAIPTVELVRRGYVTDSISLSDLRPRRSLCVYPPWSRPTRQHAVVSKAWQARYFFQMSSERGMEQLKSLRQLFESSYPQPGLAASTISLSQCRCSNSSYNSQ